MTYHTPPVFEKVGPERTILSLKRGGSQAYTDAVSAAIYKAMQDDPRVTVMTAAMCQGNKLEKVRTDFPTRFFDTGICESHAVAFAAGQAKAGMRPIVDIYSTFLQRSFDQIFQEVALQNLPVDLLPRPRRPDRARRPDASRRLRHAVHAAVPEHRGHGPRRRARRGADARLRPVAHRGPASLRYPKANLEQRRSARWRRSSWGRPKCTSGARTAC